MGCGGSFVERRPKAELDETIHFLSTVPLFKQLQKDQHPILAEACTARDFKPGEIIIKKGDIGRDFFIVRSGEASVHVDNPGSAGAMVKMPTHVNLKTGDYFGEKALVHDVPRTATIVAESTLSTFQISRHKFRELGLNETLHFRRRKGVGRNKSETKGKEPTKKSAEERLFIREALRQNENLQAMVSLDDERIQLMVDICWKETMPPGKQVISEDDVTADYFYVIQEGNFEVSTRNKTEGEDIGCNSRNVELTVGQPMPRKHLGPGASFGEMALLCFAPRSATVTAMTDAVVWVFDRDSFKKILMSRTLAQVKQHMEYLENVELLRCLLPSERSALASALVEVEYESGDLVFEQGQAGAAFYILIEGEVAVVENGEEVNKLCASTRTKTAAYFGEKALLNSEPRTATVKVASNKAKVLVLDRESFNILLGPLEDIIAETHSDGSRKSKEGIKRQPWMVKKREGGHIFRDELTQIGHLGSGAFGTVVLCEHVESKQLYALKSMSKGYIVKIGMQSSIMNEKDVLWMCDSPFITRLHATYRTSQSLELLLEAALGGSLHHTFQRKGLYGSAPHAVFYSASITCAFQYLHGMKVIYRDLKPENVLLDSNGHVKLTDMGLAKICLGLTHTVCGTPDYFAPEMLMQTGYSFALDWWTLGIFIYEMLAGDPPFSAMTDFRTYRNIRNGIDKVVFPAAIASSAASSLVRGLLAGDPQRRLPMQADGVANLERHGFYAGLDWAALRERKVQPPYKPTLTSPRDLQNFKGGGVDPPPPQVPYVDDESGWDDDFLAR